MPIEKTQKTFLEETFAEMETIQEALTHHASSVLNVDLKNELQGAVAKALNEAKEEDEFETNPEVGDETGEENPVGDETPEVPSDDTEDVSGEPNLDDVAGELPSADASTMGDDEMPTDDMPPVEEPEMGDDDVVDLTGASDEEVLQVFKKMGPEDEIEVVQTPDGNIELKVGGEEYYIKQTGGGMESEVPEMEPDGDMDNTETADVDIPPTDGLVAEADYNKELSRVKEMGNKGGAGDRTGIKTAGTKPVATVGKPNNINDNTFKSAGKRTDVAKPKEIEVAEIGKGGESIDKNVAANFEHGAKSDKRKDVAKPAETGDPKVKSVSGNMSMEASNTPNYDRGTKSTPVTADPKVSSKTTVGIAENVTTLKAKLEENHDKLVYTRQKYSEVVADNAKLRAQIQTLNENVTKFKKEEDGYRGAINTLREQFQEVAVFTSNLTHAVKLMTEHATTKEEKNQILKRLDEAKTLNESKIIYESLAASYGTSAKKPAQIDEQLNRTVSSGASAINESTAYKSPELSRMLDLMNKMK